MNLARVLAGAFGIGRVPVAGGTLASAVAALIGAGLMLWSPYALPVAAVLATVGGVWVVHAARADDDPGWVVIDEFAGQWIAMLGLARVTPWGLLAAFLLFRVFDITKLGPVGWADRRHDAIGVMGDDVIAGAIAAAILWGVQFGWAHVLG
ncbi:MAG TPA: phosphatidylglycerophosphatase A [Acetobacteraceae bacterium]|jgi:phosphatidylglycerophosphatase A